MNLCLLVVINRLSDSRWHLEQVEEFSLVARKAWLVSPILAINLTNQHFSICLIYLKPHNSRRVRETVNGSFGEKEEKKEFLEYLGFNIHF